MPLVAHNELPTLQRLREEGLTVLPADRAAQQDIRELHVGLLNMMPDSALEATERQFFRMVGGANPIAQFYVHPFTLDQLPRGDKAAAYVSRYYEPPESAYINSQKMKPWALLGIEASERAPKNKERTRRRVRPR